MADTFASIPGILVDKGVAMNTPPASLLSAITKEVQAAAATLPPGSKGALVGVATMTGVNLALVSKVNEHITVTAFIGKTWSQPIKGGAAVQITF